MPRYASSIDVARLAGVSQSAVSRAFTPGASVSKTTRKKVLEAAAKLGYQPSLIPQIMLNHRSNLVAVVIGELYNPCYWMVLQFFLERLKESGRQVLLVNVESGHFLDATIPRLAGYRVDAIVSTLPLHAPEAADELARFKIPVVLFNNSVKNAWISSVSCDNRPAGRQVAELFVSKGAQSFAYVAGAQDSPASDERLSGFSERLRELGMKPATIYGGDFRYEGGRTAAATMVKLKAKDGVPDAIFCGNDLMAFGVKDYLVGDAGLNVPRDVMIMGFDNIPSSDWGTYGISTFSEGAENMVAKAVSEVERIAHHPEQGMGEHFVVPTRLIERASTNRPVIRALPPGQATTSPLLVASPVADDS